MYLRQLNDLLKLLNSEIRRLEEELEKAPVINGFSEFQEGEKLEMYEDARDNTADTIEILKSYPL